MNNDLNPSHISLCEASNIATVFSSLPFSKIKDDILDLAVDVVMHHEGVFSEDPEDPGGTTAWGWSLRQAVQYGDLDADGFDDFDFDMDGDVDADDMRLLSKHPELARSLYRSYYWDKYGYANMPDVVAIKTMDLSVNMGPRQAHKLLQRSIRAAGGAVLVDDGIIGLKTMDAVLTVDPVNVVCALRAHARGFYDGLIQKKHRLIKYRNGWYNRAYF